MKDVSTILSEQLKGLNEFCGKLKNPICFGPDKPKALLETINKDKNVKNAPAIYLFFTKEKINNLEKLIKERKDSQDKLKIAISQINENAIQKENCLYVGSTQDLKKRMKEHLQSQSTNKSCSSMHLGEWMENLNVSVKIFDFSDVDACKMQECEDLLWDYFRPALGKRGTGPKVKF